MFVLVIGRIELIIITLNQAEDINARLSNDPKISRLYLERTEKNIDRMISIVQDLESINKLESGELTLREMEGKYIQHLIRKYNNKARVAKILGISRKSLYDRMKKYGKD